MSRISSNAKIFRTSDRARFDTLPPAKRLIALRRFQDMATGKMRMPPLRCDWCRSSMLVWDSGGKAKCEACSRLTDVGSAKRARREEIQAIVLDGLE